MPGTELPESHDQTTPRSERIRGRLDRIWEWVEAAAVEAPGIRTVLFLWKRIGLAGTFVVLVVVGYPIGEYSLISLAANRTIPKLAGDFGMAFDADWSYHPLSLKATARNVKIRPEHPASAAPIFTASEVEFQGSVSSALSSFWDAAHLRTLHTFNEITIHNGELHLERSLSGAMNVAEFWDRMQPVRRRELKSGLYHINAITFDDVRIDYLERIPGDSGGGVIQTAQANVHVDAINGSITDIRAVDLSKTRAGERPVMPTRINLSGRSSDGTVDIQGDIAFVDIGTDGTDDRDVPSPAPPPTDPQLRRVSLQSPEPRATTVISRIDGPLYQLYVQLSNIGAAAFTRTVPGLELVATRGVIHGKITLRDQLPTCESQTAMADVRFSPNPAVVVVPARYQELQRGQNYSYSGKFEPCDQLATPPSAPGDANPAIPASNSNGADKPNGVPVSGAARMVLAFNRQATVNAPPAIRSAVARDEQKVTGVRVANAALNDATNRVAAELGKAASKVLGPQGQAVVQQSLSTQPNRANGGGAAGAQTDNPLAKGAKSIGRGIKRLFGGDKKPKTAPSRQ
ncbi:MAG TPA: hypothetical protein VGY48_03600 [Vicinamibacterales bacterium]|jgi:hypothetical protein|nr:hypothetical protein [Vicinamibacterales bacterium]